MWWRGAIPGLFAGTIALLGWGYALFGQSGQYVVVEATADGGSTVIETGTTSMWTAEEFHPVLVLFLGIMLASIVCVLFGALLHGQFRHPAGVTMMWSASIILFLGAILSMFSIGMFLLPGAVLSAVAALLALAGARTPRNPASEPG